MKNTSSDSNVISTVENTETEVISASNISMYYKNGTRYEISISGDNISNSSIIFNINGYELHKILGG